MGIRNHNKKIIVLFLLMFLFVISPTSVKASQEKAIESQIKILYKGLKTHNYAKVHKVVKKTDSFFNMKKYDKIIGKKFLKELSKNVQYKINSINVYGNTADVNLTFSYYDASNYYYIVKHDLVLSGKKESKNFAKKLRNIRKKYINTVKEDSDYVRMIYYIDNTATLQMEKINGKWVFTEDKGCYFFDIYTCGYAELITVGGEDIYKYINKYINK